MEISTFSVLLLSKILLNCLEAMFFLDVIDHPRKMVIILGLVSCIVTATEQINAVCDHLVVVFLGHL